MKAPLRDNYAERRLLAERAPLGRFDRNGVVTLPCDVEQNAGNHIRSEDELSNVIDALNRNTSYAYDLADRLKKAMDYVLGQEPEANSDGAGQPAPVGALGEIRARARAGQHALSAIAEQVGRLERVVG